MKDSVLVTGGAGYIGSVVVAQLLARGYPVVVLDDLSRGHLAAVAPEATFVQGGVGDRAALDALLRSHRCHALVHLAAYALVGESVAEPEMYRANNVTAGRVLLERAAAAGVRRVVFSSSCAVYGHPSVTPIPEDAPLAPVNPYGETKRDFERVLADYARADGASVVNLRYFNAAGATAHQGEDHVPETHLIPNVLRVASGRQPALDIQGTDYPTPDGTAVRDYVHVLDIADAHVRALEADPTQAGSAGRTATVNLGSGGGAGGNDPRLAAAALQSGGDPRERVGLAPGAPAWVRELGRTDIVLFQVGRAVPTTPWELVLTSSRETKFVLAILVVFSIVSWYLIFLKWWQFQRMRRQADRFMAEIERATRLDDAYHAAMRLTASPHNRILREGINFFSELKPGGLKDNGPAVATQTALTTTQLEALRMVLAKEVAAERDAAARFLPWLATFGSVSPLLGLLGTVLGVMDAFIGIAVGGSGNIAAVAPGVAEALVTTVAGLAVAVPSVMAYNLFVNRLGLFAGELEGFAQEIIGTMAREGRL